MTRRIIICLTSFCLLCNVTFAQQTLSRTNSRSTKTGRVRNNNGLQMNGDPMASNQFTEEDDENEYTEEKGVWGRDTTKREEKPIPIGLFQWKVEERLGTIIPTENKDTAVHNFQNFNYTDGPTGHFNFLGNLSSPRLNRIYMERKDPEEAIFLSPYSHFRDGIQDFHFTNTLSPLTNLAYHTAGGSQHGEDRVRAYFATNIKKIAGVGLKIDYAYGRGLYNNASTSLFGATFYGYYLHDRYNAHAYININHIKMAENGGIEDDKYITDPQSFPQSFDSNSIPTILSDTWNRNHEQNYYLTHRFNLGFYRDIEVPDSLKPKMPRPEELMDVLTDSVRKAVMTDTTLYAVIIDSLKADWEARQIPPREFIPVSSIIHTLDARINEHSHISHYDADGYYQKHYYGDWKNVHDDTKSMSIRNTLGLGLREGFHKWAQMGLTAFATHRLRTYTLPYFNQGIVMEDKWVENDISIGAELSRTQGKLINYKATGELWMIGEKAGNFQTDAHIDLQTKLGKRDTLLVDIHGNVERMLPGFYFRHFHSQSTWYDNDLNSQFRMRVDGTLRLKKFGTELKVGFENVTDYTYFAIDKTPKEGKNRQSVLTDDYLHRVVVKQAGSSVQVLSASLAQNFKFGPFHVDCEATYQNSSDQAVLPLPTVTLYGNAYFLFRIAKVLRVQLGGDVRYFTEYFAPDYTPSIGQFAVQDPNSARIKIGNYPIVNVYANLHLKRCRLYVAANHVNKGNGRYFLAPHYPINPMLIRFGLSWNFFN